MEALIIAKYVIDYSNTMGYSITNLKLNKLLYYIQQEHYIRYNYKCFSDDIVWCRHGPVVQEIYRYFRIFYAVDENIRYHPYGEDICNIIDNDTKMFINKIVDKYKNYNGWDIVNLIQIEIGNQYKREDIVKFA